jgi:hypothetical protein
MEAVLLLLPQRVHGTMQAGWLVGLVSQILFVPAIVY